MKTVKEAIHEETACNSKNCTHVFAHPSTGEEDHHTDWTVDHTTDIASSEMEKEPNSIAIHGVDIDAVNATNVVKCHLTTLEH